MKVYLAGKVSTHDKESIKWKLATPHSWPGVNFVATDGYGGFSKTKNHGSLHNDECGCHYPVDFFDTPKYVPENFVDLIHSCDLLLAILLGEASYGSIAEMSYASAIGKPVHAIVPKGSKEHLDLYWFVLGMPGCVAHAVEDETGAIWEIVSIIEGHHSYVGAAGTGWREKFNSLKGKDKEWWDCYTEYLNSPEWKAKKQAVLDRCKGICEGCLSAPVEMVHHQSYKNVGNELLFELVGICRKCHEVTHPGKEFKGTGFEPISNIIGRSISRRSQP